MKDSDKKLLLKDLCARVPYGVIVQSKRYDKYADVWDKTPRDFKIIGVEGFGLITNKNYTEHTYAKGYVSTPIIKPIDDGQTISLPYLRPMSNMTEEEKEILEDMRDYAHTKEDYAIELVDFYNSHHLDFRNLIDMGLALEAPEGMYES
jgi:hypothetical protein